jgi:hypothetical protein
MIDFEHSKITFYVANVIHSLVDVASKFVPTKISMFRTL